MSLFRVSYSKVQDLIVEAASQEEANAYVESCIVKIQDYEELNNYFYLRDLIPELENPELYHIIHIIDKE